MTLEIIFQNTGKSHDFLEKIILFLATFRMLRSLSNTVHQAHWETVWTMEIE